MGGTKLDILTKQFRRKSVGAIRYSHLEFRRKSFGDINNVYHVVELNSFNKSEIIK
jgi:hypothetical protein